MKEITVQTQDGPKTIKAYIQKGSHNTLAVHKEPGTKSLWTLTHIPTGHAIVNRLKSKKQATDAAEDYLDNILKPVKETNVETAILQMRKQFPSIIQWRRDVKRKETT